MFESCRFALGTAQTASVLPALGSIRWGATAIKAAGIFALRLAILIMARPGDRICAAGPVLLGADLTPVALDGGGLIAAGLIAAGLGSDRLHCDGLTATGMSGSLIGRQTDGCAARGHARHRPPGLAVGGGAGIAAIGRNVAERWPHFIREDSMISRY